MNPADTLVDIAIFATSLEYLSNRESDGAAFSVSVDKLPPNMTIFNYAKNVSNLFNSGGFSNEIHFNGVTLANSPAYEMQATYGIPGEGDILKILERGTVIGNKVYSFSYASEPNLFEKYLPIAQKASESLDIFKTATPVLSNGRQQDEAITTYQSQKYGFNLKYPSTWIIQENLGSQLGVDLTLAITTAQESRFDSESENILVGVTSIPVSLSLNEFVTGTLDNLKQNSSHSYLSIGTKQNSQGILLKQLSLRGDQTNFHKRFKASKCLRYMTAKHILLLILHPLIMINIYRQTQDIMESFRFN